MNFELIDLREKRCRKEAERKEGYENEKRRERTDEGETVSKVGVRRLQSLAVSMRISGRFSNVMSTSVHGVPSNWGRASESFQAASEDLRQTPRETSANVHTQGTEFFVLFLFLGDLQAKLDY